MKKILFLIASIFILISCVKDVDKDFLVSENNAKIEYSESEVFISDTLYFKITLNNKDCGVNKPQRYDISYSYVNDKIGNKDIGTLKINDKIVGVKDNFRYESVINDDICYIKYVPNVVANIDIKFTVSNESGEKSEVVNITSKDMEISIDASITGAEANKLTPFVLNVENKIITPTKSDGVMFYPTKVTFVKNIGYIKSAKDKNFKKVVSISDEINSPDNISEIHTGNNDLLLYAENVGETEVKFEITTPRGIERKTLVFNTSTPSISSLTVDIKQTTTEVQLGQPYSFTADVKNSSPTDEFTISYRWINGNEKLTINSNVLEMGEQVITKSGIQTFILSPLSTGERELELVFTDNYGQKVVETVLFSVTNNPFNVTLTTPYKDDVIINTMFSHSFFLQGNLTKDDYSVSYRWINGSGSVTVNGNLLAEGIFNKIILGTNTLNINSSKLGNNIVEFIFKDKFNQEVIKEFSFTVISKPVVNKPIIFNITGVSTGEVTINAPTSFNCSVTEQDYIGLFTGTYRFISGSGSLKYKGTLVNVGTPFEMTFGNSVFECTPTSLGDVELEITVNDSNNQSTTRTVKYIVKRLPPVVKPLEIDIIGEESTIYFGNSSSFTANVAEEGYLGLYNCSYRIVSGACDLSVNGAVMTAGVNSSVIYGDNTFIVTPKEARNISFELTFSDSNNQTVKKVLNYTVTETTINIETSKAPDVNHSEPSLFTFKASKQGYNESFDVTYSLAKGKGTLKNGTNFVTENSKFTIENNVTNNFTFTPQKYQDNIIRFTIKDNLGNTTSKDVTVNCVAKELTFNITGVITDNIVINTSTSFTSNISCEGYMGNYSGTYRLVSGSGSLKYKGIGVTTGTPFMMSDGVTIFEYTPTTIGSHELEINLADESGRKITKTVTYNVHKPLSPLNVSTSGNTNGTIYFGNTASFIADCSENGYTGSFYCSYIINSGNTSVSVNGTTKTAGTKFKVDAGGNNFIVTPGATGKLNITYVFSDDNGQTQNVTVDYTILENEIILRASTAPAVDYNNPSLFTIKATKQGYNGSYTVTYALVQGSGTLKNGTNIVNENSTFTILDNVTTNLTFTPTSYNNNVVRLTAKDNLGNTKSTDITILCNLYPIEITKSSLPTSIAINKSDDFVFNVTENRYNGDFKAKYTGNNLTLSVNDQLMTAGVIYNISSRDNKFTVTPTSLSGTSLAITIYDDNGQSKVENISYTVTIPPLDMVVPSAPESKGGSTSEFNFSIIKDDYNGGVELKYELIKGIGNIKYNNIDLAQNTFKTTNLGENNIKFIPTEAEDAELKLTAKLSNGETISKTIYVKVSKIKMSLTYPSETIDVALNSPETFKISCNGDNSISNIKTAYKVNSNNNAQIKINGTIFRENKEFLLKNNSENYLEFSSNSGGELVIISITSTDKFIDCNDAVIKFNVRRR